MIKIKDSKKFCDHIFIGRNFKKSNDKVLVLVCGLDLVKIDGVLNKIKEKKGITLNKEDIAVYGYIYDYEEQKKELEKKESKKTDSELINRIKPKPYNTELWSFICSKKISTIYFYGSFNKVIEKRIEDKKSGKKPLKDLIQNKGVNTVIVNLGRESSISEVKVEMERFLFALKNDVESLMSNLEFSFLELSNLGRFLCDKVTKMQYMSFFQHYEKVREQLRRVLNKIEERPEICNEVNDCKEISVLAEVLGQIAAAECFIPVPMFLDVLNKTQEDSSFVEKLFNKKKRLTHRGFPLLDYEKVFRENNKSIDFEKCDEELNNLYDKMKKCCSKELLDIMTTRILNTRKNAEMKILCLPSSKISSYMFEIGDQIFNIGDKFKSKLKAKETKPSTHISLENEFRNHFDSVKGKIHQVNSRKKDNYGEWRLDRGMLWKPSKKN